MTNLTKEEYARLHLKAKHGLLTPEEQAVYFEYREEQAEAARAAAAPPPAPEPTPEVVRVEPVYEEPKERKARGFFAGFFSPSSDGYQLRCPRCGGTNVTWPRSSPEMPGPTGSASSSVPPAWPPTWRVPLPPTPPCR